jgi:hypothetical protein
VLGQIGQLLLLLLLLLPGSKVQLLGPHPLGPYLLPLAAGGHLPKSVGPLICGSCWQ